MQKYWSEIEKYMLGCTIFLSLILGGNSGDELSTDMAIQLLTLITSTIVCWRHMERPIDARVFWFIFAGCSSIILQLLPLSNQFIQRTQGILPEADPEFGLIPVAISLGLGRTLEVATYFFTLCLFLTAVLKLRFEQAFGLIPFFLTGVALNLSFGMIQYSYSDNAAVTNQFPYSLDAGFFANPNHFSSLIYISIPIAFVYFIETKRLLTLFLFIVSALLVLLAAGSTAGVVIGFAITFLSVALLFQRNRIGTWLILAMTIISGIYSIGLWARLQVENFDTGFGRLEFARTTWNGIRDNLPFGIGYGNFLAAYPSYERTEMIFNEFVNHTHNDYLELVFEGGIIAAALLVAFFWLFLWRAYETIQLPLNKAATLSLLFLLIHSLVEYPLRTFALAISFVMFVGFLFHRGPRGTRRQKKPSKETKQSVTVEDLA